jgi:DNA modification methylase
LGSGTTTKVARQLKRNSVGYEIDSSLMEIIKEKAEFYNNFISVVCKSAALLASNKAILRNSFPEKSGLEALM